MSSGVSFSDPGIASGNGEKKRFVRLISRSESSAKVVFVTNSSFFSDGSIFQHASNAAAFVKSSTPPEDLTAMVTHYAGVR